MRNYFIITNEKCKEYIKKLFIRKNKKFFKTLPTGNYNYDVSIKIFKAYSSRSIFSHVSSNAKTKDMKGNGVTTQGRSAHSDMC